MTKYFFLEHWSLRDGQTETTVLYVVSGDSESFVNQDERERDMTSRDLEVNDTVLLYW